MISRIWRGYTTPENADIYENLLKGEIIVGIRNRNIWGSAKSKCSGESWRARWNLSP